MHSIWNYEQLHYTRILHLKPISHNSNTCVYILWIYLFIKHIHDKGLHMTTRAAYYAFSDVYLVRTSSFCILPLPKAWHCDSFNTPMPAENNILKTASLSRFLVWGSLHFDWRFNKCLNKDLTENNATYFQATAKCWIDLPETKGTHIIRIIIMSQWV